MAQTEADTSWLVSKAKTNLTEDLKDPGSAQFRGLYLAESGPLYVLCGEINAKNGFGAYVGFRQFFATDSKNLQAIDGPSIQEHRLYVGMAGEMCAKKIADVP